VATKLEAWNKTGAKGPRCWKQKRCNVMD